jgi:hypothetical protein
MSPAIVARYRALAASPDRNQRQLGRAQLARLDRATHSTTEAHAPSPWAHVPLADLFREAGNDLHERPGGRSETGHEPVHRSSSGRCVVLETGRGVWWCRSCRRGGDALTLLMQFHGWSAARAIIWLLDRYGAPTSATSGRACSRRTPRSRPPLRVEVRR